LEGEKQELLKELRLAESRSNQMMDDDHTETLNTLADAKGKSDLHANFTYTHVYPH
jgi:hypothetical protein